MTIDVAVFVESLILKDFQEYWRGRKPPKEAILANIVSLFNKAEVMSTCPSIMTCYGKEITTN